MNVTRMVSRFRSFKIAPFALIALFLLINFIGIFFNQAFTPAAQARPHINADGDYLPPDMPTSGDRNLDLIILRAGARHGVDPRFIHAVIWQESKYKARARSGAGAQGLMQLMPATARHFGCRNLYDPAQNIDAGTRCLRYLLERFDGDVALTLAGYNAGEGNVNKYNGVPPYSETQNYVRLITADYGKLHHPVLSPEQARIEFHLTPEIAQLQQ